MITIKADKKIKAKFGQSVDFDVLSVIYTMMYDVFFKGKKKVDYVITLVPTTGISYYDFQKKKRKLKIHISTEIDSVYEFQGTVVHEFRHFIQDRVFGVSWGKEEYDDSTTEKYYNSPAEIDAVNFDIALTAKVIRLHNRLVKVKKSYEKHDAYKKNLDI